MDMIRSQHERAAIESLLSISQCSPSKGQCMRRTTARWSSDGPLTPPPSEEESISPPQSDDELCDVSSFSQRDVAKKQSKLAQVCVCLIACHFIDCYCCKIIKLYQTLAT